MTEVQAACLCGKANAIVRLEQEIPVQSRLCHQSQCRYNLGALSHSSFSIVGRPEHPVLEQLTVFEPRSGFHRYFCKTCGTHIFEEDHGWRVQSGAVDRIHSEQVSHRLERIVGHSYVHETIDGGLSAVLTGPDAALSGNALHQVPSCPRIESVESSPEATNADIAEDQTRLWASCICGGVQFYVTRPSATSRLCSSPWPDLIVPYRESVPTENAENIKWWIREEGKWLAGTCACRSCRLGLGSPVQAWTFVSKTNLFKRDGSELSYDLDMLQSFESTPGSTREFCRRCGATVFWHNAKRPGVVDVSVGLLRASEGALAKTWLHWWTERVSFSEDAIDKQLIALLQSKLHYLATP